MIEKVLPPDLKEEIGDYIEGLKPQIYWDYRLELSEDQIIKMIQSEDGYFEVCDELRDFNLDYISELENEAVKNGLKHFELELTEYYRSMNENLDDVLAMAWDDFGDNLREYASVDENVQGLINNSSACFNVVLKEIDHNFSGWGFNTYRVAFEDVKEELQFFKVNPRKVADYFNRPKSEFPNYHWRNGKELIDPDELFEEWENHCSEYARIVFPVEIDLAHYIENRDRYKQGIELPVGACYWIHDNLNGCCSIGVAKLTTPVRLKTGQYFIEIDGQNGY
ncbi:unnamed protein product, partial [Ectocarpus fasciculatus]